MGQREASEEELVSALRAGDQPAWNAFFDRYDRLIHSVTAWPKWHFDFHVREDVSQTVRSEIVKALPKFDGRSTLAYWIKRVCVHRCVDEVRRQVRRQEIVASQMLDEEDRGWDPPDNLDREGFDPVQAVTAMERAGIVRKLVDGLGGTCRDIIRLFYLEELSYKEISKKLSITVNTVGSRLSKCLDKLRTNAAGGQESGKISEAAGDPA